MAENSKIEWTTHTFNPWRGCTKVSAGCANCYAETLSHRNPGTLGIWGPNGTRVVAAESAWKEPLKWNRLAAECEAFLEGQPRPRVFCASLADIFEDWTGDVAGSNGRILYEFGVPGKMRWVTDADVVQGIELDVCARRLTLNDVRSRLFSLIDATPNLDWLLLTKRPENVLRMCYDSWCPPVLGHVSQNKGDGHCWKFPPNVWLGTSVEDQATADERIPHLLKVPAKVRFLSIEPLLGPVDIAKYLRCESCLDPSVCWCVDAKLGWGIIGGESGHEARPCSVAWIRSLVEQCKAAGVPVFVKQLGAEPRPSALPSDVQVRFVRDKKGGDWNEWPADLRVREFPV